VKNLFKTQLLRMFIVLVLSRLCSMKSWAITEDDDDDDDDHDDDDDDDDDDETNNFFFWLTAIRRSQNYAYYTRLYKNRLQLS